MNGNFTPWTSSIPRPLLPLSSKCNHLWQRLLRAACNQTLQTSISDVFRVDQSQPMCVSTLRKRTIWSWVQRGEVVFTLDGKPTSMPMIALLVCLGAGNVLPRGWKHVSWTNSAPLELRQSCATVTNFYGTSDHSGLWDITSSRYSRSCVFRG